MIAADSSTWVAFIGGDRGKDVETLERGLTDQHILLPPAVLTGSASQMSPAYNIEDYNLKDRSSRTWWLFQNHQSHLNAAQTLDLNTSVFPFY